MDDEHTFHMYNVAYRAVLEVCLEKGEFNTQMKIPVRFSSCTVLSETLKDSLSLQIQYNRLPSVELHWHLMEIMLKMIRTVLKVVIFECCCLFEGCQAAWTVVKSDHVPHNKLQLCWSLYGTMLVP